VNRAAKRQAPTAADSGEEFGTCSSQERIRCTAL
jgi:hypothetical protein